jgi:subtilisin family serine protease
MLASWLPLRRCAALLELFRRGYSFVNPANRKHIGIRRGAFMYFSNRARLLACASSVALCVIATAGQAVAQVVPNPLQYDVGLIGAQAAWNADYTGQGVVVTVADSGIDPTHPRSPARLIRAAAPSC